MNSGLCFRIRRLILRFRPDTSRSYSQTGTEMVNPTVQKPDGDGSVISNDDNVMTTSFDYIYPAMSLDEIKEAVLASFGDKRQKRGSPHFGIIGTIPRNEDVNMEEIPYLSAEHQVLCDIIDIVDSIPSEPSGRNSLELTNVVGDNQNVKNSTEYCSVPRTLTDLFDPSSKFLSLIDEDGSSDQFEDFTDSSFESPYLIITDNEEDSSIEINADSTTLDRLDPNFAPIAIDGQSEVTYDISDISEDNDESFQTFFVTIAGEVNIDRDNKSELTDTNGYKIISSPLTNAVIEGVASNQSDIEDKKKEEATTSVAKQMINRDSNQFNGATLESLYAAIACSNLQHESKDGPAANISDDQIDSCIEIDYSTIKRVDVDDDDVVIVETNSMKSSTSTNCLKVTDSIQSEDKMEDKNIDSDNGKFEEEKDKVENELHSFTIIDGTEDISNGNQLGGEKSKTKLKFGNMMDIYEASNHDDESSESCVILRGDSKSDGKRSSIVRISFGWKHLVYLVLPEMPKVKFLFEL